MRFANALKYFFGILMPIVYNEMVKKPYLMLDGPQLTLQEVPWHSLMLTHNFAISAMLVTSSNHAMFKEKA